MKRILSLFLCLTLVLSMAIPISAENTVLDRVIVYEQKTSHANGSSENLSDGVEISGWFHWFCCIEDDFASLYDALSRDNVEMIIKYTGDVDIAATFTHWGSVSDVGCSDVITRDGYNYAIFDTDAVKDMFTKFAADEANIDENGNVKDAMTLSLNAQNGTAWDTIYGLYVVEAEYVDPATLNVVTVDMDKTYQTIDGWGASYTWYSDWLPQVDAAEEGYDWIFNEAEFNILRFRDLNGVIGDERAEATTGYPKYKAYYDAAIERGIEPIVLVTSWGQYARDLDFVAYTDLSANGYSYYTLAKDENGEYMYDELAEFCVQSVQCFIDAGIPVDYFSISNEIELQERHVDEQGNARDEAGFFFGTEETDDYCAYWKAHLAIYNAFKEAFGDDAPSIIGAETMGAYADLLEGYLDPLFEVDPDCVDVVAHHLYGTTITERNFAKIANAFSDYRLWQTEWYQNDYFYLAEVIVDELVNENLTAWLYWDGVWIEDEGNCLIEISTWTKDATIKRNGGHYIMTHFSKFIKNGYVRVDVSERLGSKVAAFVSPDRDKLVMVVANDSDNDEIMELNLDANVESSCVYQSVESTGEYLTDLGEYTSDVSFPAGSLTTIVFNLGAGEESADIGDDVSNDDNATADTNTSDNEAVVSIPADELTPNHTDSINNSVNTVLIVVSVIVIVVCAAVVIIVLTKKKK